MGQESFIYSFVARGTMVLVEYTEFTGNFPAIAAQCLQRLSSTNNKFTYNCDHHIFNFLVEDGYGFRELGIGSILGFDFGQLTVSLPKNLLENRSQSHFWNALKLISGKDMVVVKPIQQLQKVSTKNLESCRPLMKEHMQYIIDHADEIEKLLKVKAQVSEVKSIMLENIDKTIERGQNLTDLNDKAQDLRESAQVFKTGGTQLRRKLWYQNMKIKLVVLGIILFLVLIIILSVCGGFNC
ncbi:vesicle-associated membrane protein 721-like isoform X1 [Salvia hispanica]|uniref:vesicle-associated membrane protein 721-like isoform X1 n=1 Tax=Salvia hispanica TaxID=49212 RepID=UPI002009D76D|nr:vesicle-associated membrane protein 721-like isoform X1 [Salvia hispanica]